MRGRVADVGRRREKESTATTHFRMCNVTGSSAVQLQQPAPALLLGGCSLVKVSAFI
jgi:hypothetical protein